MTATGIDDRALATGLQPVDQQDSAEWVVADGFGGYACGEASELPTRRYHSWLTVAGNDGRRRRLLAGVDERVGAKGAEVAVTPAHWSSLSQPTWPRVDRRFTADPVPTWEVHGENGIRYSRSLVMQHGRKGVFVRWRNLSDCSLRILVRPLLACEDSDALLRERSTEPMREVLGGRSMSIERGAGEVFFAWNGPVEVVNEACWYRDFRFSVDEARGYDGIADRYSPCAIVISLAPGQDAFVAFTPDSCERDPREAFRAAVESRQRRSEWAKRASSPLGASLRAHALDFFWRDPSGRLGVLAGFPWFSEWGRDAFVSLPGLTLSVDEQDRCWEVMRGALPFLRDGLLPNIYGDSPATSHYGSADAALWFSLCAQRLLDAAKQPDRVRKEFGAALLSIVDAYRRGSQLGLRVDEHGLLCAGSADRNATWMDAQTSRGPVTPRAGQPVEIVALWCSLLQLLGEWHGGAHAQQSRAANAAFRARFWNESDGSLHDCRNGDAIDDSIRPNMLVAAALRRSPLAQAQRAKVVAIARKRLVTPCGLRTLSPSSPFYHGRYEGSCDERDHAYHQGTAWPWLCGFYVEAALRAADRGSIAATTRELRAWLEGFGREALRHSIGHVSEVFDGDEPQRRNGTFAQAWNTGELLRALRMCEEAESLGSIGAGA